jgi:hypothetical protein
MWIFCSIICLRKILNSINHLSSCPAIRRTIAKTAAQIMSLILMSSNGLLLIGVSISSGSFTLAFIEGNLFDLLVFGLLLTSLMYSLLSF